MYFRTQQPSNGLGWFVGTQIRSVRTPEGHEELTKRAAAGLIKDHTDLANLRDGVRQPDLADPSDHIRLGQEKRHFLRPTKLSSFHAWLNALGHIRMLHQQMMATNNRAAEFRLMGEALHSIQDACAPAHVERDPKTGDIIKLRVYDPVVASGEHVHLRDDRDDIFSKRTGGLKLQALSAISASRLYLKMALNQVDSKKSRLFSRPPAVLARELNSFIFKHLWMRLPELRIGSEGEHVMEIQIKLNFWLGISPNVNLRSLPAPYGRFDTDTATVLEAFQIENDLKELGVVKRATWEKLLSL